MRADAVLGSLCTRPCAYCKHYRKHTPGPTHCVVAFTGIRVETRTRANRGGSAVGRGGYAPGVGVSVSQGNNEGMMIRSS